MLFVAAGGPGDLVAAAALSRQWTGPSSFATFLWKRSASDAGPVDVATASGLEFDGLGHRVMIEARSADAPAQIALISAQLHGDTYVLDAEDLARARATVASLLSNDPDGRIAVVDAGGDVLAQKHHRRLRSPLLEATTLRILADIDALNVADVVVVGPGLDNELSEKDIDARAARLGRGAPWAIPGPDEAVRLLAALEGIDSETSRLWLHAILGHRGRVWSDSTGKPLEMTNRSVEVSSFSATEVYATGTAASVASRPRTISDVNEMLVAAGFVDELHDTSARPVVPPEAERTRMRRMIVVGDYVTERFSSRFGVTEWARVRSAGSPMLQVEADHAG